jgi:hypothetical protein
LVVSFPFTQCSPRVLPSPETGSDEETAGHDGRSDRDVLNNGLFLLQSTSRLLLPRRTLPPVYNAGRNARLRGTAPHVCRSTNRARAVCCTCASNGTGATVGVTDAAIRQAGTGADGHARDAELPTLLPTALLPTTLLLRAVLRPVLWRGL